MAASDVLRVKAIALSARFAEIGESPAISVARAEMFLDFLSDGQSLQQCVVGQYGLIAAPTRSDEE